MGSNKKNFDELLTQQKLVLDKEILKVKENINIKTKTKLPIFLKDSYYLDTTLYKNMLDKLINISTLREIIDSKEGSFKDIFFGGYVDSITTPITKRFAQIKNLTNDNEIIYHILLLNQLNIAKENTALQRGFVSYFMEKSMAMSSEDISKWEEFKSLSNSFHIIIVKDEDIKEKIKLLYNIPTTKNMLLNIDDISLSIMVDAPKGRYKEDTTNWFTFLTQKITLLSKIEVIIIEKLEKEIEDNLLYKQIILIISLLIWLSSIIALLFYQSEFRKSENLSLTKEGEKIHFELVIALLTKIANSKGTISHPEKDVINYTMNSFISMGRKQGMSDNELIMLKEKLNGAYKKAKVDHISITEYANKLESCSFELKVQILKQLVSMASIDGYSIRKKMMIYEAVEAIGFDKLKIQKYINDIVGSSDKDDIDTLKSPYEILGCKSTDDDNTIKRRYIEQIKEFHPDYIQGKGLNSEIIKFAEQRLKEINRAHEEIKKERKNNNN
jgi:DnaJ like chaperone protein